jgi:hypothetical protein
VHPNRPILLYVHPNEPSYHPERGVKMMENLKVRQQRFPSFTHCSFAIASIRTQCQRLELA